MSFAISLPIPWSDIIGMRHVLVHHYFRIDLKRVWQVVSSDIPWLKDKILNLLEEMDRGTLS